MARFLEHIEWTDKTKKRCRIYWRRPEEWGELLYEWASSNGLLNTVITLTDIIEGEDTANECKHSCGYVRDSRDFSDFQN